MTNPKISVIVPIYKVEKYLVQCIDSILNQTLKDIEVILVDEGDMDACRFIIDHYEQTDSRVRAIHEKNGGYGASCNKGFDIAQGEYISIIESDDFIEPDMYEEMYNYAKSLDADVVKTPYYEYFDAKNENPEKVQLCFWYALTKNIPEGKLFSIEEYPIFAGIHPSLWAALYKREYLKGKNIRCIEAKGAGYVDNHFRLQTLCKTNKIAWLNKPFNYYRLTNENASTAHYNLGTFILRWADVHKLVTDEFPEKWDTIAPYCIKEEWINVFFRFSLQGYKITQSQCNLVKRNLAYTTEKQIKKASLLSNQDRKILLKYKKNASLIDNYIDEDIETNENFANYATRYEILLFGISIIKIKVKQNRKWKIFFFNILPAFTIQKK